MAHRHHTKQRHNEYFLHDPQIRRDVITADICRYLGNDALVRPGTVQGQQGFIITAYRNLTSEMIADLRAESDRLNAEDERREQQGYPPVSYTSPHDIRQAAGVAMGGYPISSVSPSYPTTASPVYSTVSQPGFPAYSSAGAPQDPRYTGATANASPGPDYYQYAQNVPYGQPPQPNYYAQDPYRNTQRVPPATSEQQYGHYTATAGAPGQSRGYDYSNPYDMDSGLPTPHSRESSMPVAQHPAPETRRPATREHRHIGGSGRR